MIMWGYGYGPQWGMMPGSWGYAGYSGYGPFGMIIWVLILIAVVVGIVWLVRSMTTTGRHNEPPHRSPGLDVLEERYGRGEINRDEYLQKKRDMGG
jgi:putative membrane protein